MNDKAKEIRDRLAESYAFMAKGNAHEVRRTGYANGFDAGYKVARDEAEAVMQIINVAIKDFEFIDKEIIESAIKVWRQKDE